MNTKRVVIVAHTSVKLRNVLSTLCGRSESWRAVVMVSRDIEGADQRSKCSAIRETVAKNLPSISVQMDIVSEDDAAEMETE